MILGISISVALSLGVACGQSFEVASIKLHQGPVSMIGTAISGTRVTMTAYTVSNLIMDAYGLKDYQVAGATSWIGSDRYDIVARSAGDGTPTRDQAHQMLQVLLTDRFRLKIHRETKEMPVYALVIAKSGPKLKDPTGTSLMRMSSKGRDLQMTFTNSSMEGLVTQLKTIPGVDRPVLDETGLAGSYDFQLNLAAEPGGNPATGLGGESIFTAIEEQLGLKLESRKVPIGILVIDHVERPSEN
jgi:uncharacterized protein (TIGR03435 family)